jgi:ABC-type transporter MlaC component
MFNKKLFIRLSTTIVLATAAFCAYHYYESSHRAVYSASPIDAQVFYSEFVNNQADAITKYNNQPIKIKGVVADRNKSEGAIVINLETGNASEGIECELDASFPHEKVTFEAGEEVIFKGICVGTVENEVRIVNCVVE